MHDHINYARTGPGAARAIRILNGEVLAVNGNVVTALVFARGENQRMQFIDTGDWKAGQILEITIASFDAD